MVNSNCYRTVQGGLVKPTRRDPDARMPCDAYGHSPDTIPPPPILAESLVTTSSGRRPKRRRVGVTELSFNVDARGRNASGRGNALFLMPTENQMRRFCQQRFDRASMTAPSAPPLPPEPPATRSRQHLLRLGYLLRLPSRLDSLRQIASVDADLSVDEFDHMGEESRLAQKRIASSRAWRVIAFQGRVPERINGLYCVRPATVLLPCRGAESCSRSMAANVARIVPLWLSPLPRAR